MALTLVVGPNNSGKSELAEQLAARSEPPVCYLATLPALAIHRQKIRMHQSRRPSCWRTLELRARAAPDRKTLASISERTILLDGLGIYVRRLCERQCSSVTQRILKSQLLPSLFRLASDNRHLIVVTVPTLPEESLASRFLVAVLMDIWPHCDAIFDLTSAGTY
jgi:adenosyl cobinamide kinase/adenosyl cobinamide phosphate guanylyltransferase